MDINWVTAGLAAVVMFSTWAGVRRGLAYESGHVVALAVSLVVGTAALSLAWWGSNRLNGLAMEAHPDAVPDFLARLVQFWQQAPGTAQWLAFALIFLLSASLIRGWLDVLPRGAARIVPRPLRQNRILGGLMGAAVGAVRCVALGGLLFLGLQYLSMPTAQAWAQASPPYRWLQKTVYQPWLKPLMSREIPVLSQDALRPLTENINLVAVPVGGDESRGVLVVQKPVAQVAERVTHGDRTDREKAYDLYEWEIHHVHYDWKKYDDYVYHGHWAEQSPLTTLTTGKGVCADYALLYADMAHAVGLTVKIDEGIGGTAQQHGPHAWNEVWDAQQRRWLALDTTWGAEQDIWFAPPDFWSTHMLTHSIEIQGAH
ncbi:transglutaminase domain-containing protein [Alicyclobacillus shizuokensis]|uniref:transglutaminase domain-containing protein n=1 Tax=Alicyclobacillus shizuokensis TaxID=392014 RepID=UPI00082DACDF|nr:transglutaminase domain-containing protein [Alicyclobacillus shizuokensis]